jgi:type I restriction enzyme S subunit
MRDLEPYPAYKDSGVPWLGRVPEHWRMERLGYSATLIVPMRDKPEDLGGEIPWVRIEDFRGRYIEVSRSRQGVSAETVRSMNLKVFPVGTVLCSCSCTMGATAVAKGPLVSNQTFIGIVPDARLASDYVYYLMQVSKPHLTMIATGAIQQYLSRQDFSSLKIPVPAIVEQRAVVGFLSHVDRHIKRYIRAKQKLIKLLEEQKEAILHRTMTHGLDPDVGLKPSGIEWLGDVPEHWEVCPFVRCAIERADYRGATPEKVESGVFLVTAKNIRNGWIDYDSSKEFVREDQYKRIMRRGLPRLGDVLLTTEAPLGHVALVDREDVALAQRIIRFRMDERALSCQFALRSMLSPYFQRQLAVRATGSTAHGIKASKLPQVLILRPPLGEQANILAFLETETTPIEIALDGAHREISLLREYRTRLIADVVTGKVDVRAAAASLPDEADDVEALHAVPEDDDIDTPPEGDEEGEQADPEAAGHEAQS